MTEKEGFSEVIERVRTRIADRTEFLPYALFEETSSQHVNLAAWICSFPLSLTDDLAVRLLDFASRRLFRESDNGLDLGDMAPMLVDILRSSNLVINGSDGRWRYEHEAREYFRTYPRMGKGFAREIHKWLLNYYEQHPSPAQTKREAWTQRIRTAYHQTPLEPKKGVQEYATLFGAYRKAVFQERVSTLMREQYDWLDDYSVEVAFYQGMTSYDAGMYEEAKVFFEEIHSSEPLLRELRSEIGERKTRDQITASLRRYGHIAVARHLLGNIVEHQPQPRDEDWIEGLYRDSLYINRVLENEEGIAHVEHSLGDLLAQRSEPEALAEAENLLRQSLRYVEADQDAYGICSVQLSLGSLLAKMGPDRYDEAIERFKKGLERAPYYYLEIRLQLGLGRVLAKRSAADWEAAEQAFSEALSLSRRSEETSREIEALRELLLLAQRKQDRISQLRFKEQLSEAYAKRGSELTGSKEFEDATDAYRVHIDLSQERGDNRAVAGACIALGNVQLVQGNFEVARQAFEQARSIEHDQLTEAEALLGLGKVLNSAQRWKEAVVELNESSAIFSSLGDVRGVAKCNAQLGEAYAELSRPGFALRKLEKAYQSFEELEERYDVAKVAIVIARVLDSLHHHSEALEYARQGLETLLKLGHRDAYAVEPFVNSLRSKVEKMELLVVALHDKDISVRWRAAQELGELRDTRAVESLITALKDRSRGVRMNALESLRRIGTHEALAAVREYEAQESR